MIQEREKQFEVKGNLVGDRVPLSIDAGAMTHIMNIMTDLYSDPELAIIREYSTNALDAHIEAGIDRPIEVTLPTPLSPYLTIRDFGIGLTVQDIHDIYSKYGASTKRGTNDQVGMLGLGCKSALTYTNQFTLSSIRNGIQIQASISRDDDGTGSMTIVDERPVAEHDGTLIIIPTKRGNTIEKKAATFFQVWKPGTVLVNGSEPVRPSLMKISDRVYLARNTSGGHRIVMGNVAYPAGDNFRPALNYNHCLICFVDIGDIDFTPSREALQDTKKTKEALASLRREFDSQKQNAVQSKIDDEAKSHLDAVRLAVEWDEALFGHRWNIDLSPYSYKGLSMTCSFELPYKDTPVTLLMAEEYGSALSAHTIADHFSMMRLPNVVWLYGYDPSLRNFTAYSNKKLLDWARGKGLPVNNKRLYVMTKDKPSSPWIDQTMVFPYEEVDKTKLPRVATSGRKLSAYDVYTEAGQELLHIEEIDTTKPMFYTDSIKNRNGFAVIKRFHPKYSIVVLPENRLAKFKRTHPNITWIGEEVKRLFSDWQNTLTHEVLTTVAIHNSGGTLSSLTILDPNLVLDPQLKEAILHAKRDIATHLSLNAIFYKAGHGEYKMTTKGGAWHNPLDRYPLYNSHHMHRNSKHCYAYLNMAYEQFYKGK